MKVAKIEQSAIEQSESAQSGEQEAKAELVTTSHIDFIKAIEDNRDPNNIVLSTRTSCGVLGITFSVDLANAESHRSRLSRMGTMTIPGTIRRIKEGPQKGSNLDELIRKDTILGRMVLTNPDMKIRGDELRRIIEEIYEKYPAAAESLSEDGSELSMGRLREIANLMEKGIDAEDLKAVLFGMRDSRLLEAIITRKIFGAGVHRNLVAGESFIATYKGFSHPDVMAVYGENEGVKPIGARVVYPRTDIGDETFVTRFQVFKAMPLSEVSIPIDFYRMPPKRSVPPSEKSCTTDQVSVEEYGKLDRDFITSYPSTELIFKLLERVPGGRKAAFIRGVDDFRRAVLGDQTLVRTFRSIKKFSKVNALAALEREKEFVEETEDPRSHAEIQLLEELGEGSEISDGILFCKYFPAEAILKRLDAIAYKIRGIVFRRRRMKNLKALDLE